MYPALRLDHLRYLEKCGLIKPASRNNNESCFGFSDLTALRQIAGELQQGAAFRAVVRNLQASRTGQLTFDFRLDAQPARIIELKPRRRPSTPGPWNAWNRWHRWNPWRIERGRAVFPDGVAVGRWDAGAASRRR